MKREEQRLLAGGLNVLPPSDKTPENDAIDLVNFRVDQSGVLRGDDTFSPIPDALFGASVHTYVPLADMGTRTYPGWSSPVDIQFPAGTFLVGAGTNLYVFWQNYGGSGQAQTTWIAGGFDGQPLGIVIWNGFIWIMNRAQRMKINPVAFFYNIGPLPWGSWLPPAPTTACAATDNPTSTGGLSGTYSYYCTYLGYVFPAGQYGDVQLIPVESAAGPAAEAMAVDGTISITSLPINAPGIEGATTLGDICLYRSGGTLSTPYLVQKFAYSYAVQGNYPSVSTPFVDTTSDAALRASGVSPSAPGSQSPAAPTSAPSLLGGVVVNAATEMQGTYQYYVTFVNDAGLETNIGPASNPVTPTEGQVQLSNIPISADATVVARRIYRSGGTLGGAYQVTQINDNTSTTYVDTQSDLVLTEAGILAPGSDPEQGTNDPPPAALGLAPVPYFNYLLAFDQNRLYWSQNGVPVFPGSAPGSAEGNWVDLGTADDPIVAITIHSSIAVIYKSRSIWRLLGDPVTGYLEQTGAAVGAVGTRAVANGGAIDFFISTDGVYRFTIDQEQKLSGKVDPIFLNTPWYPALGGGSATLHRWGVALGVNLPAGWSAVSTPAVCAYLAGTVLVSDGVGLALKYHVATDRWSVFAFNGGAPAITAVAALGSAYLYYAGFSNGTLGVSSQANAAQTYVDGSPATADWSGAWQTRFLDQGLGDQPKRYQNLVIDAELNGAEMYVSVLFDDFANSGPFLSRVPFGGTTRQKYYLSLEGSEAQLHVSVRLDLASAVVGGAPPAIHGLYLYYEVEARPAAELSIRAIDFASEWLKLARRLVIDSVGTFILTLYTDEPGPLNRAVFTTSVSTTTRQVTRIGLPPNLRGRMWRAQIESSTLSNGVPVPVEVYSLRAWMRDVGTTSPGAWDWEEWLTAPPAELPNAA